MDTDAYEASPALQVIAEKLLEYLRSATDDGQKAEVAQRIGELAERFAPDTQWFIDTMNQVGLPACFSSQAVTPHPAYQRACLTKSCVQ